MTVLIVSVTLFNYWVVFKKADWVYLAPSLIAHIILRITPLFQGVTVMFDPRIKEFKSTFSPVAWQKFLLDIARSSN